MICLIGFFRCTCGKMHTTGSVTHISRCTCGVNLWTLVMSHQIR